MATTVDDVARATLASVGSNAGLLLAIRWVSDRYRQLSNNGKLKQLRVVTSLTIPAPISGGNATCTRDSNLVVPDATALPLWQNPADGFGSDSDGHTLAINIKDGTWFFRRKRNWYKITDVTPSGNLMLDTTYTEDSDSAPGGYKIVKRHHALPSNLRFLGRFVQQRLWRPVPLVGLSEMDLMHPERLFVTGTGPEIGCEVGDDAAGNRLIEFYPYALKSENILFYYFAKSPDLTPGMLLPNDLDVENLKMGVLIDVYRFEMSQCLRNNKVDAAAVWRNELRAQETTWRNRMEELYRVDSSADDLSIILHTQGPPVFGDFTFIRTARQDAISRVTNFP